MPSEVANAADRGRVDLVAFEDFIEVEDDDCGGFAKAVQGADEELLLVARFGEDFEVVNEEEVLLGSVEAKEDGSFLVVDASSEFGLLARFLGWEQADDVSHLTVLLGLISLRDGLEAREPIGMGVGPAEVLGGSRQDHGC